jgi:RpiB/LacA/LacB family sugar-phosphate isomerase
MSRLHNDSNCLILGGRVIGPGIAGEIIDVWMNTPFEGGRHAARLAKIEELSQRVKDLHDK